MSLTPLHHHQPKPLIHAGWIHAFMFMPNSDSDQFSVAAEIIVRPGSVVQSPLPNFDEL